MLALRTSFVTPDGISDALTDTWISISSKGSGEISLSEIS